VTFPAQYPNAIVVAAHPTNILRPVNKPKALFLHTPEEPVDDYESTPRWFQRPNIGGSTHYYADSDGDIYQMVPEENGAIANGLEGKPRPAWADATSLNYQSLSIEIEGFAAAMHRTCPPGSRQWNAVRTWIVSRALVYRIPIDRAHVMGHYEVSNQRSDPGTLKIDQLVADAATVAARLIAATADVRAHLAIREALSRAWEQGDWRMIHRQLHVIGVALD